MVHGCLLRWPRRQRPRSEDVFGAAACMRARALAACGWRLLRVAAGAAVDWRRSLEPTAPRLIPHKTRTTQHATAASNEQNSAVTPSGCLTLDRALGGGYPKGRIVEVRERSAERARESAREGERATETNAQRFGPLAVAQPPSKKTQTTPPQPPTPPPTSQKTKRTKTTDLRPRVVRQDDARAPRDCGGPKGGRRRRLHRRRARVRRRLRRQGRRRHGRAARVAAGPRRDGVQHPRRAGGSAGGGGGWCYWWCSVVGWCSGGAIGGWCNWWLVVLLVVHW